ncbi:MAG: ABC transporter ATP-binding protein [Alphaproteobacteria bacterium]
MAGTMPLVAVDGLVKEYRLGGETVRALAGINVAIEAGEFVAVMGPSGCGKSTFMNLLGCLDRPTAGSYRFEGRDVAATTPAELAQVRNTRIGFVFQSFNLLPRLTAAANVELPLAYGRRPRGERRTAALRALDAVGLAQRTGHLPTQLSGGQQQRVAIARAVVARPALLLADEPTGALDTRTGIEIMALFQALNRDGITVVVVTHEPEVAAFARRLLRFRDGRLVSDEVVSQPADAAAALAALDARERAA